MGVFDVRGWGGSVEGGGAYTRLSRSQESRGKASFGGAMVVGCEVFKPRYLRGPRSYTAKQTP